MIPEILQDGRQLWMARAHIGELVDDEQFLPLRWDILYAPERCLPIRKRGQKMRRRDARLQDAL